MLTLGAIMKIIEKSGHVLFENFKHALVFDPQAQFMICDIANDQRSNPWSAISIDTGELTENVSHEVGIGPFFDSVLYFISRDRDCILLLLPEADVAIQLAQRPDSMLASQEQESEISSYQSALDFAKLGERNKPWTQFVYEWKELPSKFG